MKRNLAVLLIGLGLASAAPAAPMCVSLDAVFTMNNGVAENHVLAFKREPDGSLTPNGAFSTGGAGTGAGLGNQGGLALSRSGHWLFVCNAGSHELSVFAVTSSGLELTDRVASQGMRPISLALHENLLYVLNAGGRVGGQDNIAGFTFQSGRLLSLPGSIRPLSGGDTDPAQIGFSPDGHVLVVTEKATGMIDTYTVDGAGLISEHKMFASAGPTPFGFAFRRQHDLIVSEAAGGMPDLSSLSSYEVSDNGDLEVISASVPTTETAACWVVVSLTGRYAYASNTGSGTISGFRVQRDGTLERIDEDGVTAESGMGPIDMAFNRTTRYLYVLNAGSRSISILQVGSHGSLTPMGAVTDLPAGSNGLVAR